MIDAFFVGGGVDAWIQASQISVPLLSASNTSRNVDMGSLDIVRPRMHGPRLGNMAAMVHHGPTGGNVNWSSSSLQACTITSSTEHVNELLHMLPSTSTRKRYKTPILCGAAVIIDPQHPPSSASSTRRQTGQT